MNQFIASPKKEREATFRAWAEAEERRPAAIAEIDGNKADAKADRTAAAGDLERAGIEAEGILDTARTSALGIVSEARETAAASAAVVESTRRDAEDDAKTRKAGLDTQAETLTRRLGEAHDATASAVEREEAATARESEAQATIDRYNGLIRGISQVQAEARSG